MDVKAMPTFLLLKDGAPLEKVIGANPEEIKKKIDGFIQSICECIYICTRTPFFTKLSYLVWVLYPYPCNIGGKHTYNIATCAVSGWLVQSNPMLHPIAKFLEAKLRIISKIILKSS